MYNTPISKLIDFLVYIIFIIVFVIFIIRDIQKRQKSKKKMIVVGEIKAINKLEYEQFGYEDDNDFYKYELIIKFKIEGLEYTITNKVVDRLYQHKEGNEINVYIDSDNVLNSSIEPPFNKMEILGIFLKYIPFLLYFFVIAYLNWKRK